MATPQGKSLLRRVSTQEALVSALRDQVLEGALPAGTSLREADLSETFGVSRHTVRSALQTLAHEGLIRLVANRGAFIPKLTGEDIVDLFTLRTVLEVSAIEDVPATDATRLAPIKEAVSALKRTPKSADWAEVRERDLAFHEALVESLGSERVSRVHGALLSELRLCLHQIREEFEDVADLTRQHQEMLDALLAGKPKVASKLLRTHLDDARNHIVARLSEHDA